MNFMEQLPKVWQENWEKSNFTAPTLIQERCFPLLESGENVLAVSPTGSGKTLAYLWPLLLNCQAEQGVQLLVLLPSQELAVQVLQVAKEWASQLGLRCQGCVGGANITRQIDSLKKKPEVIIGTPGRILELVKRKKVKLHQLKSLVLDEVDQYFQKSQETSFVSDLLKLLQKETQLVCVSATGEEQQVQEFFQKKYHVIDVTTEDRSRGEVEHLFLHVPARKRHEVLKRLTFLSDFQALVFFNQLTDLGNIENKLLYEGVSAASLASDQTKMLRKAAMEQFHAGKRQLLLTTDLAARGLDFSNLPYVIHYEPALSPESYLHRSGRVGRMGAAGSVITLVNEQNSKFLQKIFDQLSIQGKEVFFYQGELQYERRLNEKEPVKLEKIDTKELKKAPEKMKEQEAVTEIPRKPSNRKKKDRHKLKKNKGMRKSK